MEKGDPVSDTELSDGAGTPATRAALEAPSKKPKKSQKIRSEKQKAAFEKARQVRAAKLKARKDAALAAQHEAFIAQQAAKAGKAEKVEKKKKPTKKPKNGDNDEDS